MSIFKTGGIIRKMMKTLLPFIGLLVSGVSLYAVPADEIDWGWEPGGEPTFPNEAYGPITDVDTSLNEKGLENIGDNHLFDVWCPDGPGPFPVYVYAHGGGFVGGSKRRMVLSGPLLQNDGVVYVNIHYTLNGQTPEGVQQSIDDVVACLEYLKANAQKYKINPEQIFVGGGSAGNVIFNYIVYEEQVSGIIGIWNWNHFSTQFVSLGEENMGNFDIPVVSAHPDSYPSDNSHSALSAFNHCQANYNAGSSGIFFKAIKEHPSAIGYEDPYVNIEQIWKDGQWIKDSRDGSDTGERIPNLAEWIYEVIGNEAPVSSDYEVWKTNHGITDDLADDDNDGIVNRLEFALGGNPKSPDAESCAPTVSGNGSVSEFVFHRGVAGLDYTVESSLDLDYWETLATVDDSHGLVGSAATVLVPDSQNGNGTLFLRLKVENAAGQPPPQQPGDPELAEIVAGINAKFENVEMELLEWPSELHDQLGAQIELAYLTRPVESNSEKLPLIIALHGGGPKWWEKSLKERLEISAEIDKKQGYDLAELAGKELIMLEPNTTADWRADELDTMLDYVLENFPEIDTDRVYVTGYSKGGTGSWVWLNESADRFAAAAIGGAAGRQIDDVTKLVNLPLWLIVGGDDGPATGTQNMVNQLRAAGNVNVEHTVIEGGDHQAAGDAYFISVEMVDWLLGFKLPRTTE